MARENFRFGSGSKNFSRQNENFLAPLFQRFRAAICTFPVRIAKSLDDRSARPIGGDGCFMGCRLR
nr:hypothetical protein [Porphyromonas gulae]